MTTQILNANTLDGWPIASGTVQTIVTSPPYWGLRDYGIAGQLGQEKTPDCLGWATGNPCGACYVCHTRQWAREAWRVLRDDGTFWLNLGDSYASATKGSGGTDKIGLNGGAGYVKRAQHFAPRKLEHGVKDKDLMGIPWAVAFALRADGWFLRSDIIWHKPNPMPESVTDRPTKAHEYIFLLTKKARYFWDAEAVKEPAESSPTVGNGETRNLRSVWTIATRPYSGAHFATMPPAIAGKCILAGSRAGDIVLDPFSGSGTTGRAAATHRRRYIGLELNPAFIGLSEARMTVQPVMIAA